jgi:uncharacterized protein (TIGR00255 family)
MTGFARREGADEAASWTWEIKTVNGKGLDLRLRVPTGAEAIEAAARSALSKVLARGNVTANLTIRRGELPVSLKINRDILEQVLALAAELRERGAAPASSDGLLSLRGVVEAVEEEEDEAVRERREERILRDFGEAVHQLLSVRYAEGARLVRLTSDQLDRVANLAKRARECAGAQPRVIRERLQQQIADLVADTAVSEDRLAQEVAILAAKADVREELDRTVAHVEAARQLLGEGGPIGRRLDFLCQEFNREANTLCSKSADIELTRLGLEMKSVIEQLREQVQNIE